ncbi:MAG: hypothetical protein QN174_07740 [Armatimonadota bacterium]|nr:hypothetical protein [Armatimonadota bacterium]
MARGDVKSAMQVVAAGGRLEIRPGSADEEWVVHNLSGEDAATLEWHDGTHVLPFVSYDGPWSLVAVHLHVRRDLWLAVRNDHATLARLVQYDGIQTK